MSDKTEPKTRKFVALTRRFHNGVLVEPGEVIELAEGVRPNPATLKPFKEPKAEEPK